HWTSKGAQVSDRVAYLMKHVPSGPQGGRIEGHVSNKVEGSAAKAA
ncbi:MAG: hypothetical protein HYZ32_02690, partial [Hydrocarboniphaga effusa]|nr:hypothetical protein [Hydrocarboniphaga effusa]